MFAYIALMLAAIVTIVRAGGVFSCQSVLENTYSVFKKFTSAFVRNSIHHIGFIMTDTLGCGGSLGPGGSLTAPNCAYNMQMQGDGNLVARLCCAVLCVCVCVCVCHLFIYYYMN